MARTALPGIISSVLSRRQPGGMRRRWTEKKAQANQSNAFCGGRPRSHSRHQQLESVRLADGKQGPPARATAYCFGFATSGQTSKASGWMPPSQMLQPLPWKKGDLQLLNMDGRSGTLDNFGAPLQNLSIPLKK